MDCREIGWESVDWMYLALDGYLEPVVGSCEHGNDPSDSIKRGSFLTA